MRSNTIIMMSNVSMVTSVNSNPFELDQIYGFAVQAVWTGTPVGTLSLQVSNDIPPNPDASNSQPPVVTNWDTIANSSTAVSGPGTFMWNFNGSFYRWVRLSYTAASGSGSLSANIQIKGV